MSAPPSWAGLERASRRIETPCGDGRMVWRLWGETRNDAAPLVLLHGGAGSWLHWLHVVEAFRGERLVIAPDLPGLGESAAPPEHVSDGRAAIVAAGLDTVLGEAGAPDMAGFSFGGVVGGLVAGLRSTRSLTLVGAGGLGVIRQTARLERVRDKEGDARLEAHRTNLLRWMIADPARIDDEAVAIQDWNSRHARFDSRALGHSDILLQALPRVDGAVAGIWGAHDHAVQGETDQARAALRSVRPDAPFEIVPDAGHWVAQERPAAFIAALHRSMEFRHEHA